MSRLNNKGLSNLAALIILAISAFLLGIAGYLFWSKNINPTPSVPQSVTREETKENTKKYEDSSKLFSLPYPVSWTIKAAADCCEGAPKDYSKTPRPFTLLMPGIKEVNQGASVQADSTEALATSIRNGWTTAQQKPQSIKTNGYPAEYVRVNFKSDAERYIDHQVLITNNAASAYLTFRVLHDHPMSDTDFDHTQYTDEFTDILNSIQFRN